MRIKLNANQLKMIAVVSMVIDHVGYFLLPQVSVLRWTGRLALPIFAYFIAEGCCRTGNIWRYFLRTGGLGLICVAAVYIADGRLYGNILITFALSIFIVGMLKLHPLIGLLSMLPVLYLCLHMEIDYGFTGILIPAGCWAVRQLIGRKDGSSDTDGRLAALFVMAAGLIVLAFQLAPYQWMGLFALPLLALYDGTRGKKNLKWFFYLFYPLHILVIEGIAMLAG